MANDIKLITEDKNADSSQFDSGAKLQFKEIGSSGTQVFAGYFSEEYLQLLRGRRGAKVFDEMRRSESQIAMLLSAVMNPIKSGVWEFEAAAEVPDGEAHKELIEHNAKELIDWETHLHEALTALIFGYSIFEIVHTVVFDHPKFGTFNGLKGLAFRSQKTIERWNMDSATGNLKTVTQWTQGDLVKDKTAWVEMLAEFLLIFTLQKEGDNYEGISALRPMYGPWFRKNLYLKIAAIGMEKNAIGTPVGTAPIGKQKPADEAAFKQILQNFTAHESAYLIKPNGWEVEILKSDFDASKIKEMILLENTEMINSMVANFLALGTNGGGGAFALGSDLSDFFLSGIQNYANIICGVWNRKLIPDLIKLNYGQQVAYPKLKVSGINDKAGKELAEIVKILTDSQTIKADDKTEEWARKQFKLPKADPTTARELVHVSEKLNDPNAPLPRPPAPKLSEKHLKLAETWKVQWKNDKAAVKDVMSENLNLILDNYKKQIKAKWKSVSKSNRSSIMNRLEPKGVGAYKASLQEELARIANVALAGAKKETPKAAHVKLSEYFTLKLADAPRGGYFNALPPKIKKIVKQQASLIADTQAMDLQKIVSLQFATSVESTEDVDQVLIDIESAAGPTIEGSTGKGMSTDAAAGNSVSTVANRVRMEWFFEPEVLDTIESFTFTNEDPISEICQALEGTTWAKNDPDLDRYSPPLHHNCKSRIEVNEVGDKSNPELTRDDPKAQKSLDVAVAKASDSITLCECDYHLQPT